jgi:copper chaperone CopZ
MARDVAWSTLDVNCARHLAPRRRRRYDPAMKIGTALALAALLSSPAMHAAEKSVTFKVLGWHSKGDAYKTEVSVRSVKGVSEASANFAQMTITVTYEDTQATRQQLEKAIADAGYSAAR